MKDLFISIIRPNATPDDSISIKALDDLFVKARGFNRKAVIDNAGNTKFISMGFALMAVIPLMTGQKFSDSTCQ